MGSHRASFTRASSPRAGLTRAAALALSATLSTALVLTSPFSAAAQVAKPIAPPAGTAGGLLPVPPQPSPSIASPGRAVQGPDSVADLAAGLLDAVVNISTSQNVKTDDDAPMPKVPQGSPFQDFFDEFFKGRSGDSAPGRKVESLGSGFVIDPAGYIVTNNHVIEGADDIEVNFANGSKLKAKLIGTDTKTDLAVLKVEPKKPLTAVPLGDSRMMRIGDWVMAIGNPFGLGGTVTVGIISARGRNINAGPYDNFIQTDAAINRGNSGGPLFNMKGEVIGINTAIISPSGGSIGIGFSVPTELASNVITQLKDFGETRRGWLGVRIQPVTDDIAESLGMDTPRGALVAGVIEGGPISKGEIKAGDVITKFDGRDVSEMRDLPRVVAESPVGKAVDVIVIRDGKEMTVQVTLGRLEDADVASAQAPDAQKPGGQTPGTEDEDDTPQTTPETGPRLAPDAQKPDAQGPDAQGTEEGTEEGTDQAEPPAADLPKSDEVLGMKLALLEPANRRSFGISDDVEGVVITEVDKGSVAAERRVIPGDVIVEIGQEAMKTPEDVSARVEALKADGRRNALMMISSKTGELRFVTVRIE